MTETADLRLLLVIHYFNVLIMRIYALFFLIITLGFSSCKGKEKPLVECNNEAPFYVKGNYNGVSIDYKIGENDYFMKTSFEKQIRPNKTTIYYLKSFLSQKDSIGFPNSLQLIMYANTTDSIDANFNVDSLFYAGLQIPVSDNYGDTLNEMLVFFGDMQDPNPAYISSAQSQTSFFIIKTVEPYNLNDLGQKTVRVTFDLDCEVKRIAGPTKRLNISGAFAFAYPY